ncbi:mucin-2-like isoform X2 [Argopecten irradians]|uniref:mucin-2-like isoform X2 n=1 Tax=Argopecten irradians TaxID=31199 RepID=UPI00371F61EC
MLTTTEICYDPSSCTWSSGQVTNGVLDENSLQAFSTSISGLTGFDFAVGLTAYDTTDGNHPGLDLAGIYYTEGDICISNDLSLVSSITKANTGGAGFHIAHFLGRHLGSLGDGEPGVLCAVENFIMSPTWDSSLASVGTLSNPYRWSICSLGYLFTRIQESFTTNNLNCLKVNSFPDTDYTNNRNFPDLGQDFNLTAQCQIALGDTSTFCGMQQESLCWEGALCTNAANGLACDVTIQVLDGTPCYPAGVTYPDKICVSGECVTGTTTTSTPTTTTPTPTTTTSTPTTTRPTPTTTTTTSIPTTTTTISTTSTTSTTTPITTTTSTTTPATTTPSTTTPSTTTTSTTTPSTTTPSTTTPSTTTPSTTTPSTTTPATTTTSTTTPSTTTPSTTTPSTTTPSTTTTSTTTPATTTTSTTTPSTTTTSITTPATTTTSTTTPATTTTSTTTPATTTTSTTTPLTTSTSTISSSTTTTSTTTPSTTTPVTTTTSTTTPSTTTPSTTTTSNTTPSTTTTSITTPSTTTTSITTPTTTTTSTTTPSTTTTSTTTPATTTTSTTTPLTTSTSTISSSTTTPSTTTTSTTTPTTTTTSISTPTTTTPSMPTTPFLTTTQDLDRCREVGLICDPNARCIKEAGQFVCRCNPPYEGNGEFCVAVTPPTPPGPAIQRYQDTSMLGRTYRSTNYEQIPIGKQYPDPNLYPTADPSYPTGNTFSPYPSTVSYYPGTPVKSAKSSKKKGKSSKSKKSSKSRSSFSMMDPFMNGPANMFQTYQKHWSL